MNVTTGLQRLISEAHRIERRRIGLLANYASVTTDRRNAAEVLAAMEPASLVVYGPEHGFWGAVQYMESADDRTYRGTPIRSLYDGVSGYTLLPEPKEVAELDLIVVDLQDVGVRYYTYYASAVYCMLVAAAVGVPVLVLDRPNPINGVTIEGPSLRPPFVSLVGQYPMPVRHGMTIGELALMLNAELGIGCDLSVLAMEGWQRAMWWDETGLPWVNPSPQIPTFATSIVYPGMCLWEGTNVSEGRGYTRPFEVFGAPWLDKFELTDALNELQMPGVRFEPFAYVPMGGKHAGEMCDGAIIVVTNRETYPAVRAGAECLRVVSRLRPQAFEWHRGPYEWAHCAAIDTLTGGIAFRTAIDTGNGFAEYVASWEAHELSFRAARKSYLLYS